MFSGCVVYIERVLMWKVDVLACEVSGMVCVVCVLACLVRVTCVYRSAGACSELVNVYLVDVQTCGVATIVWGLGLLVSVCVVGVWVCLVGVLVSLV